MSKIVDRDTFLYYLDNADVNWEATARECIAKVFELGDENKKLKDEIGYLKQVLLKIKDIAMCVADCEQDCDNCMQGRIHQLIKEALNGKED